MIVVGCILFEIFVGAVNGFVIRVLLPIKVRCSNQLLAIKSRCLAAHREPLRLVLMSEFSKK